MKERIQTKKIGTGELLRLTALAAIPFLFYFLDQSIIPKLYLWIVFFLILFFCGPEEASLAYVYLLFFIPITRGSSFSAVAIVGLALAVVACIKISRRAISIIDVIFLLFICIYCFRAVAKGEGVSRVSMIADVLIAFYIRDLINNSLVNNDDQYLKRFFFYIFFAAIISIIHGFLGYVGINGRFIISIGADKASLLLVTAAIYPLFHLRNRMLRIVFLIILLLALLLTVSMTGLVCLLAFVIIYVIHLMKIRGNGLSSKQVFIFVLIVSLIAYVTYIWQFGSSIRVIDNVVSRTKLVLSQLSNKEYEIALTGRYEIWKAYLRYYDSFSISNRLFGGGNTSYFGIAYFRNYSHNTLIDTVMCFGIIGTLFIFLYLVSRFRRMLQLAKQNIDDTLITQIVLLKVVFLLTSLSVSVMTSSFWTTFVLL